MKTFIITIEIEHTDRSYNTTEIQEFIAGISIPQAEWVKTMKKAFRETTLGEKAESITVEYAIREQTNHVRIVMGNVNNIDKWRVYVNQELKFESENYTHALAIAQYYKQQ
jgi:CO/xanthine dehydrogenase FAD-binding subunit